MLDPNRLYSINEAQPYTGSRSSTYRAIRAKKLRAVKAGRLTKLRGSDIMAYVANLPVLGGPLNPTR
jgi:excisionase family DNA binding protein